MPASTLAKDAGEYLVNEFGEEITVFPQASDQPEDSSNPIYFEEQDSTDPSFTEKVRVYHTPSEEMLQEYGFEEDTEAIIYNTNGKIEEADEVEIFGDRFVVRSVVTSQLGQGKYLWVYNLVAH